MSLSDRNDRGDIYRVNHVVKWLEIAVDGGTLYVQISRPASDLC